MTRSVQWAWKSLRREPARTLLVIAGITAVGALLFDMLLLSRGLLVSFEEVLEDTGYDVRVTATSALPGFGPGVEEAASTAAGIRSLPEVAIALPIEFRTLRIVTGDAGGLEAAVLAAPARRRNEWRLLEGRDYRDGSVDPPEAVINRALARDAGLGPGDEIALAPLPREAGSRIVTGPRRFLVTGIVQFPFSAAGQRTLGTTRSALREAGIVAASDEADMLLVASADDVPAAEAVAAIRAARPDLHPFTIWEAVETVRRTDFSYFRQISLVLSSVTAFFAFLLVTTVLTVSINQRTGEVAALRALGISRSRVVLDLLAEAVMLVGLGGALALPVGYGLARMLDAILRGMPEVPERLHFFVLEPRAVLLHGLILAATGMLASLWPMLLVARLPIADTLRREVIG